jgi:hypothetical protein
MTIREKVYAKYNGLCAYTGKPLGDDWQEDHIVPLWLNGSNSIDNRLPALRIVNHYKRGLDLEGFRKYMTGTEYVFAAGGTKCRQKSFIERMKGYLKKDGTVRKDQESRYEYMKKVAAAFDISEDRPFDGIFFFERFDAAFDAGMEMFDNEYQFGDHKEIMAARILQNKYLQLLIF